MTSGRRRATLVEMSRRRTAPDTSAEPGDWVQVHMIGGGQPRRGQIIEVLGDPGHERYRVRWDEQHESIFYPADGVAVVVHEEPHP